MTQKLSVVIEHDAYGYYAFCPQLKGCHTQGDTLDETMDNIREAVALYLETLTEEERDTILSSEIYSTSVEVDVA